MKSTDRWITLAAVLAITAALAYYSRGLWAELFSAKWTHPLQPKCLVGGFVVGAVVGIAVGVAAFHIALRRIRAWYYSVPSIGCAAFGACVLGGILALLLAGQWWPSEGIYGIDGDHLIGYGMAGGAVFATLIAGGLSTLPRRN